MLFNIFGGITRCDEVARGLIEAFDQISPTVPFVVRLDGTNDVEGRALLAEAKLPNVYTESTMDGAAAKGVELANAVEGGAGGWASWSAPRRDCACPGSPAARARSTRCATATTAPMSSAASPPARAART